jgi:hypothetical protein
MKTPKTKKDLENLIKNKIEEGSELEYKSSGALEKSDKAKSEIAKDVSAMANAVGGLIIYGIKESSHVPREITPIDRNKFSKEWLEQVINSGISPKIEGLKIISISVNGDDGAVYVIEIPQGNTAHQNSADCKYYRRYNFEAVPMKDYEIRDVMSRMRHPAVELEFEIEKISNYETRLSPNGYSYQALASTNLFLKVKPLNNGNSYAKFINYFVELPREIVNSAQKIKIISESLVEYYGENVVENRFDPILPKLYGRSEKILLVPNPILDDREVKWRIHADNAPLHTGSISLNKIRNASN